MQWHRCCRLLPPGCRETWLTLLHTAQPPCCLQCNASLRGAGCLQSTKLKHTLAALPAVCAVLRDVRPYWRSKSRMKVRGSGTAPPVNSAEEKSKPGCCKRKGSSWGMAQFQC